MTIKELNKKEEIVEQLAIVVEHPIDNLVRKNVDILKKEFYKLKKLEMETSIKTFVEAGGKTENFQKEKDITEEKLKELLIEFRKKKFVLATEAEKVKEQNLIDRKNIIEKIKELIDNQGSFHEIFDEFKELQHRWKEIARIPQNATNGLWKEYHYCCQQFYDWMKLNDMMRNYDFKKNLELKQELCEVVERLDKELNIVSAFHQL